MERIAVADVGTNSILLLVAERQGDELVALDDLSRVPRLGQGVAATGRLEPGAAQRSLEVLREYRQVADGWGADRIAVGTQVLREARDGSDFLARAEEESGWRIHVLSGEEEAEYTYRGVRTGAGKGAADLVVYDIGGGSTEVIHGAGERVLWSCSLQIGAVRLTERFLARRDPPAAEDLQAARAEVEAALATVQWPIGTKRLVGVGGTTSTLGLVHLGLREYRDDEVERVRLSREQLAEHLRRFASLPLADRRGIPGLPPERADVILAGTLIVEGILHACGRWETGISGHGVRYGVAWTRLFRPEGGEQTQSHWA